MINNYEFMTSLQRDKLPKRRQAYYMVGVHGYWSLGFRKWRTTRLWIVRVRVEPNRYKHKTVGTADTGPDSIEYRDALLAASGIAEQIKNNYKKPEPLTSVDLVKFAPDAADVVLSRRALSIPDFCNAYGMSVRCFYANQDDMPRTVRLGNRRLILVESLPAWEAELLKIAERKEHEKISAGVR